MRLIGIGAFVMTIATFSLAGEKPEKCEPHCHGKEFHYEGRLTPSSHGKSECQFKVQKSSPACNPVTQEKGAHLLSS